jgi:Protein of unknown function (DUF3102)
MQSNSFLELHPMSETNKKSPSVKSNPDQKAALAHSPSNEKVLAEHADAIRARDKQAGVTIVEIGRRLIEAKALVGHGNWLPWLEREFRWTAETALRFMHVTEAVGKNNKLLDLNCGVSSLYLLAAPSTPPEAVEAVIERAERGEKLSGADVKKAVSEAKQPARAKKQETTPPPKPPKQSKEAREAECQKLQEERFEKSVAILEDFHKEYYDMPVWDGIAHEIRIKLKALGRHLNDPPPFGIKEAVAILIDQYGYDKVSDEVLEHNP